jgi:hypothetical protein|tara:strand:+ start:280 stop:576 length:297 start_codon:yes stop_codon:yes gene_type:complete
MRNYQALKSASKVSVNKQAAADAVYNADGSVKTPELQEELQVVKKCYNSDTGEAAADSVQVYSLSDVEREIDRCKAEVAKQQADQGEWEALETDLKAL